MGPSNTAAVVEDNRRAALGKRFKVTPGSRCVFGFKLPGHLRLVPPMTA